MKDLTAYLDLFMDKTGYPDDAKDTFRDTMQKLLDNAEAAQAPIGERAQASLVPPKTKMMSGSPRSS